MAVLIVSYASVLARQKRTIAPMRIRRRPLPSNRRTLAAADTVAALGYWLGFLATLGADVLHDIAQSLRARVTRTS